ncbi:glutamine amidotransferase class-I [Methylobacterium sp. ME121]|nr:glutamine amidotransferase class-I [Methylobacterium sp. ME121]
MPGSVGRSSGEIYLDILSRLAPGAACDRVMPADADAALPQGMALAGSDAAFLRCGARVGDRGGCRVSASPGPPAARTDPEIPLLTRARLTLAPRRYAQARFRASAMSGIVPCVYWANSPMGDGRPIR